MRRSPRSRRSCRAPPRGWLGSRGGPPRDTRAQGAGRRDGRAQVRPRAERHLAARDPDLAFVYFGDTDEVAHDLGPLCQEYTDALLLQDAFLGRLLAAIRSRATYADERWTVIVTTDHGHVDEGGHGGVPVDAAWNLDGRPLS
ncbi:alkaline phosphatase family protein [Nonomuraea sp. NPDC049152]|uniref:alkaline phosphatase family protein n=1 Tax=Nonomuraea sp. NPDC049152 TaxID=3154350 RepID=UPI0033F87137